MSNPWLEGAGARGASYDRRFDDLAAAGHDVHGEADLVTSLGARSVLDAGCGTGRVAIELARRGMEVVGVDLDPAMLAAARGKAPNLAWVQADIAEVAFHLTFEAVLMAGNVMIFLAPGREGPVLANLARLVDQRGWLVAGFSVEPGRLQLGAYDRLAAEAGLELVHRWATWDRSPCSAGASYAVSVHRPTGGITDSR